MDAARVPSSLRTAAWLHPLAVILALAVGSVIAGIAGAVVAVPIVAVITRVVPELRRPAQPVAAQPVPAQPVGGGTP